MNNANIQSSPALRIEAVSINCIMLGVFNNAINRNLLIIAESLTAEQLYVLLYFRIIILIFYVCRNAQSITMITDGYGNPIAGGNNGGKSHISYKPYGEIHRTDSSGPDITRFKYTGQEEDKESSLLYYKARYYDPMVGRFLQADSMAFPDRIMGMNRYMYTEGNPVRWSDRSGHSKNNPALGALIGYMLAEQFGLSKEQGALLGGYAGSGKTKIGRDMDHGARLIGRNIDPVAQWAYKSSGLKGMADTFNKATGQDYEKRKRVTSKDDIGRTVALRMLGTAPPQYYATYQVFKQLGANGGEISIQDEFGLGVNSIGVVKGTPDGSLIGGLTSPAFGIAAYFVNFSIQQGLMIHQRNVEHRNKVSLIQCGYITLEFAKQEYIKNPPTSLGAYGDSVVTNIVVNAVCNAATEIK